MASPFAGQIMIFAGTVAPVGWAVCDGRLLSIEENKELFNVIGTTFGGDGATFAVPDLRGRVPLGQGQGPGRSVYQIGQTVGAESVTLTTAQTPEHGHIAGASNRPGGSSIPYDRSVLCSLGGQAASEPFQTPAYAPAGGGEQTPLHPNTIGTSGHVMPHDNLQPYLVLNFYIALSSANR